MKSALSAALLLLLAPLGFAADPDAVPPPASPKDYQIAIRDTIEFQMYNQIDMTMVQRVTSNGEIRLPLVGTVKIAEMTLRDAERKLEGLFREGGFFVKLPGPSCRCSSMTTDLSRSSAR